MNGLVQKEVRSILPAWLLALVLAILPVWIVWPGPHGVMLQDLGLLVFAPFGLGVLVLSLTPFGQELNWGTFPVLLSQPVARHRIWTVKVSILAAALGIAFLAFCLSNYFRVETTLESMKHTMWRNAFERPGDQGQFFANLIADTRHAASQDTLLIGGLVVLAGFAGGLWTTLLFRQVTAAFWLTLLVPSGLAVLVSYALGSLPDIAGHTGLALILGAYSVVGFIWAKGFFLRVQDTQWTGGVVVLPSWDELAGARSKIAIRRLKPIRALLRKEFQAQQVNLLLAAGLLLLHLGVIALRHFNAEYLSTHRSVAMTLEMVPMLWLVMPLLIGSVSIAEERKLGMFQNSLCLPASRRAQFFTKLLVVMVLGIFFGALLPMLVEGLVIPKSVSQGQSGLFFLDQSRSMIYLEFAGATVLTLLGFYGSSLTRNALQAMGAGLLSASVAGLIMVGAVAAGHSPEFILWRGPLIALIGWPVMVLTMLVLTYRNHSKLLPDTGVWLRNAVSLFLALLGVAAVTTTIYHRAWEAWLPEEPFHRYGISFINSFEASPAIGPRPLRVPRQARTIPKLASFGSQEAALLPDGRLWLHQQFVQLFQVNNARQGIVTWWTPKGPWYTGFVAGSNWRDVAIMPGGCFGIQADGSLWDLTEINQGREVPKRVGESRDWMAISAGLGQVCGLKTDGTLWQWGWRRSTSSRGLGGRLDTPRQVGADDDWVAVCASATMSAAVKADGSIWRWDWNSKTHPLPERWLEGACTQPVCLSLSYKAIAAVCADGSLWIGGDLTNSVYLRLLGVDLAERATKEMVRWGHDSDWKEIRFVAWGKAVGIKRDGSLWEWNMNHVAFGPITSWVVPPVNPSRYNTWVSVCDDNNAFLALAQDGSLCLWGEPDNGGYDEWNPNPSRLTMPSRIKARKVAELFPLN